MIFLVVEILHYVTLTFFVDCLEREAAKCGDFISSVYHGLWVFGSLFCPDSLFLELECFYGNVSLR